MALEEVLNPEEVKYGTGLISKVLEPSSGNNSKLRRAVTGVKDSLQSITHSFKYIASVSLLTGALMLGCGNSGGNGTRSGDGGSSRDAISSQDAGRDVERPDLSDVALAFSICYNYERDVHFAYDKEIRGSREIEGILGWGRNCSIYYATKLDESDLLEFNWFPVEGSLSSLAWSPDGRMIAIGGQGIFSFPDAQKLYSSYCRKIAWAPDSRKLACTGGLGPQVSIIDLGGVNSPAGYSFGDWQPGDEIRSVAWLKNDKIAFLVHRNARPESEEANYVYTISSEEATPASGPELLGYFDRNIFSGINNIAFSPDETKIAFQGASADLFREDLMGYVDIASIDEHRIARYHENGYISMFSDSGVLIGRGFSWSPDGKELAIVRLSGRIQNYEEIITIPIREGDEPRYYIGAETVTNADGRENGRTKLVDPIWPPLNR